MKKKLKSDNSKIYLGISLELLRAVCGQFSFRQFLVPPYISSQSLQVPYNVVSVNYRVLICCSCHFQSRFLFLVYFGFFCLQVSSVSNFCPDTGGEGSFIQAHLFNCAVGREEHCKQISPACVGRARSVWATLGLPSLTGMCAFLVYTAQAAGWGNFLKWALKLSKVPRSEPLRFRFLGTPQKRRLSWACSVLCPSQV